MGNLIVKDNALIEASHKLGEVEQRLILLAILKAREHCDSVQELKGKELVIHANDYIQEFNVDKSTAYRVLKKAILSLFRAEWGYKFINEKGSIQVAYRRFIQSADYVDDGATVHFKFADDTVPMLVELERNFTTYEINQVANLSSQYAMRLYEFCIQHLDKKSGKGWLDISLDELRFRFGLLPTEYKAMSDFKRRVLDYSICELNKNTDISIYYNQKKQGRKITGFKFEFKQKTKTAKKTKEKIKAKTRDDTNRDPDTLDIFDNLTDKEREIVAQKMAYADQKGITDLLHRQNLINQALKSHRQAEEQQKAKKAEKQAQKALKQAEIQAKAKAEQQKAEQAEQRRNTMIATFESLTPEQQDLILDEVYNKIKSVGVFAKIFKENRQNNTAHTNPMFAGHFYQLLGL